MNTSLESNKKRKRNNNNKNKNKSKKNNEQTTATTTSSSSSEPKIIEYDINGTEICFLFRKFGKCRYGDKCNRSHLINTTDNAIAVTTSTTTTTTNNGGVEKKNNMVQKLISLFTFNQYRIDDKLVQQTFEPIEKKMVENNIMMISRSRRLIVGNNGNNNNIPKSLLKDMKRHHYTIRTKIESALAKPPILYERVILNRRQTINFSRMRPLVYLLLKPLLKLDVADEWLQSIGNSLIAMLQTDLFKPISIERRLIRWGIIHMRARKLVVFLWNIMIQSSQSKTRISSLVLKCEREVRNGDVQSIDYARALNYCKFYSKFSQQQPTRKIQPINDNNNNNNNNNSDNNNTIEWINDKVSIPLSMLLEIESKVEQQQQVQQQSNSNSNSNNNNQKQHNNNNDIHFKRRQMKLQQLEMLSELMKNKE
ncbi:hypothetical protein DFA_03332 [Cavenderia fasciculata]|uniref:C3H1-type domain-containing protein n=1 Tax=Cavenderia fasciculata TaxID=261658 RepID=F4PHA2_CACFS|nr:uncharacterized protein DFA_03332 [Cavenderia fasciculata]EGG25086.1 hypothetical protein DFA_03332 [Cavenderia fasciculata]|eukprot:XP_004362937.1 hypothetical protein DFA_03332 [Cavenderia fasciculata]